MRRFLCESGGVKRFNESSLLLCCGFAPWCCLFGAFWLQNTPSSTAPQLKRQTYPPHCRTASIQASHQDTAALFALSVIQSAVVFSFFGLLYLHHSISSPHALLEDWRLVLVATEEWLKRRKRALPITRRITLILHRASKKNYKEKHSNMPKSGSNKIHSPSLSPAERECEITMSTGLGQYNEQGGRMEIGREKGLEYY